MNYTENGIWDVIWSRPYVNYEKHHQLFWHLIRQSAKGSVLDLGCGSASCWKGTNLDITGVDFSSEAIYEATNNVPSGLFLVGDIGNLNTPHKFDTVVLCGVVNYYRDLDRIFNTINGASKPGTLIIITINVIKDFPDREWNKELIKREFSKLGQVVTAEFYPKVGYYIEVVAH